MMDDLKGLSQALAPEMRGKFISLCMRIGGGQSSILLMFFLAGGSVLWIRAILTSELNLQHVSVKFVSHLLTTEQKEHRVDVEEHQ